MSSKSIKHTFTSLILYLCNFVSIPHLFRVCSATVRVPGVLTKSNKKSIIENDGEGSFVRVWRQLRAFTKTLPSFNSSLSLATKPIHGQTARKENAMNRVSDSLFGATVRARFARAALALSVTLLAACGGGSPAGNTCSNGASDYPTCTPPTAAPTITLASVTPAQGAVDVPVATDVTFVYNYTDTTSFTTGTASATCNGTAVASTVGTPTNDAGKHQVTVTISVSSMPNGTGCTVSLNTVTATGTGGSKNASTASVSFTTVAAASWWPPKTIAPMGTKVYGTDAVRLPVSCTSETEQCWKDLVMSGDIKWVSTSVTMVGFNNRPIVIAVFVDNKVGYNGQDGLYHTHLFYADTGEKATNQDITDGGNAIDLDWVVGNAEGALLRDKRDSKCWQLKWNPPTTQTGVSSNVWDYTQVTCP